MQGNSIPETVNILIRRFNLPCSLGFNPTRGVPFNTGSHSYPGLYSIPPPSMQGFIPKQGFTPRQGFILTQKRNSFTVLTGLHKGTGSHFLRFLLLYLTGIHSKTGFNSIIIGFHLKFKVY